MSEELEYTQKTSLLFRILTGRELILVLRLFLGVVFLSASIHKIQHPEQFAVAIRAYQILPPSFSNLFALLLAWTEALASVLLILGLFTKKAASAIFILLATFIVAVVVTLARGFVIDCGCFGGNGHDVDVWLLVRNILLITAAILVVRFDRGFLGVSDLFTRNRY